MNIKKNEPVFDNKELTCVDKYVGKCYGPRNLCMILCYESGFCDLYWVEYKYNQNIKYTFETIYYDLSDIRKSVDMWIKKTRLPEFFFWKVILKPHGDCKGDYWEKISNILFTLGHSRDYITEEKGIYIHKNLSKVICGTTLYTLEFKESNTLPPYSK